MSERQLAPSERARVEWRFYSGDNAATKYSPLDQINESNVATLRIAWRRPQVDAGLTVGVENVRLQNNSRFDLPGGAADTRNVCAHDSSMATRANRQKPSGIASKEAILRVHLILVLGSRTLDTIRSEQSAATQVAPARQGTEDG
jgi:hypothetical protein